MQNDVDIYIIQKQTTLERYAKTQPHFDFFNYLEKDQQTTKPLQFAHQEHTHSRNLLIQSLKKHALSYKIFNLDEILKSPFRFYQDHHPQSGLNPQKKLIISLGGDGTFLHASHYVGGEHLLLGINSCPKHSVGHLCSLTPNDIEKALTCFVKKQFKTKSLRRLKLELSTSTHTLPLALNDVLLCNQHPAATSRYQISICSNHNNIPLQSEKQLSSGLWIATATGSTAAISSYNFPKCSLQSRKIFAAVREPFTPRHEQLSLPKLILNGDDKSLLFFSRMRQGLVCVDGPDSSASFSFGDTVKISLPQKCALKMISHFFGSIPSKHVDHHG